MPGWEGTTHVVNVDTVPVEAEVEPLEAGGIAPYPASQSAVERVIQLLIRVSTDANVDGWGEVLPTLAVVDLVPAGGVLELER